jgi:hypothetical protein
MDETVTLPKELVERIINTLDSAAQAADLGMDIDDYEETFTDLRNEAREARDDLKVASGRAKRFDDHFTKAEGDDGEDAEVGFNETVDDETVHRIWTVLDAEGELAIMPGRHYVNRLSYVLTTEPWTEDDLKTEWVY